MNKVSTDIFSVGVNDCETVLFEELWPLTDGISYNSYLIIDDKIALIDSVEYPFAEETIENIHKVIGDRAIDYLIVNHMEPDHSSSIKKMRELYPDLVVVGNKKTLSMLGGFYNIKDNLLEVNDGYNLSLGKKNLVFYLTPMLHWPETMMTYCVEEKTLFSGDAFGSYGVINGVDDKIDPELDKYKDEILRYYSNIVGKYAVPVARALSKLSSVDIEKICSTHGPAWINYDSVKKIINIYDHLSRYEAEKGVVIAYGTMYGNTELAAIRIKEQCEKEGVKVVLHKLTPDNLSFVLRDIFKYDTIIIGSPTYNMSVFPFVANMMGAIKLRGVVNRKFGYFGSYTWTGGAAKKVIDFGNSMKWNLISQPVAFKQTFKYSGCDEEINKLCDDIISSFK